MAVEVTVDKDWGVEVYNETEMASQAVLSALAEQQPEVAALVRWSTGTQGLGPRARNASLFERDRFVTPPMIFDQFRVAHDAIENDDVVSGWMETTENLAFSEVGFSHPDEDEEDVWNQVAEDLLLDDRMREIWREFCTCSQVYVAMWWGRKSYKVRGKSAAGVRRKKTFDNLRVPVGLTLLDPLKVVPVGNLMFNKERLCLPGDTRIWTTNGPVRMEDLQVGEDVWSWDGTGLTHAPVVGKIQTGKKPILRIRTLNHELRTSPDHPVLCLEARRSSAVCVWKRAADIGAGDVLVGMSKFNERLQDGQAPSPAEAYILGLAIGDGGRQERVGVRGPSSDDRFWTFVEKSDQSDCWQWTGMQHVRGYGLFRAKRQVLAHRYAWAVRHGRDARGRLRNRCGMLNCVNPDHWQESKRAGDVRPIERYLGRMNAQFELWPACHQTAAWVERIESTLGCEVSISNYGTGCDRLHFRHEELAPWATFQQDACTVKRAPAWLWLAPREVRLAFLRGFLDADGHMPSTRPGEWMWGLGNHALSEDMRMLAVSVGWTARRVRRVTHPNGITWDTAALEGTTRNQIPNSFRRNRQMVLDETLLGRTVIAVDSEPEEPVWDIEVEGAHTFVAEGLIVHNCYIADRTEVDQLDAAIMGDPEADPTAKQLLVERFVPTEFERRNLIGLGIPNPDWLFVMNPDNVWAYRATRPQFARFAAVRLKAVFELLDLKHQLRQMDRAHLIGASNFILVIKKGTDAMPAKQPEIDALQAQVRLVARVPVIVGDHRLSVEIVTPKTDSTLDTSKHGTIDARITAYLYRMFMTSHFGAGGRADDQVKVAKIVAKGMEGTRLRQGKAFLRAVVRPTVAQNDQFTDRPKMKFSPQRIELDFDLGLVQLLLDLYDRGDLSRETMLGFADVDQEQEAQQKEREAQHYDEVFQTTVPYSAVLPRVGPNAGKTMGGPQPAEPVSDPKTAGRGQGGRRAGGGAAPGSGQGQAPRGAPRSGDRRGQ